MKTYTKQVDIHVGDKVVIRANGLTITGTVVGNPYWSKWSGWDIELNNSNTGFGMSHYKEEYDGGTIEKL